MLRAIGCCCSCQLNQTCTLKCSSSTLGWQAGRLVFYSFGARYDRSIEALNLLIEGPINASSAMAEEQRPWSPQERGRLTDDVDVNLVLADPKGAFSKVLHVVPGWDQVSMHWGGGLGPLACAPAARLLPSSEPYLCMNTAAGLRPRGGGAANQRRNVQPGLPLLQPQRHTGARRGSCAAAQLATGAAACQRSG